ncbi:unnamed protein product [Chilo suppressalis]|uniref:unspecific monooxygenase n=1 Tax=Chilo suppressalis TaxID=168631 RepID=A0ABN8L4N6_CHISP|nr:unnamed protein product [Chilo suppressalis]
MLFLIWCLTVVTALVLYLKQKYSRFSKYGVKQLTPVPLLGNLTRVVFRFEHFTDNIFRNYMEFPDERFVGRYEFVNPMVVIKDIELIKKVAVKDFENFLDHRTLVDEETDPICGRNLFSLNGQEWKDMRSTLSPAFTSSKMRQMLPFMVEVGNQMIESLKNKFKQAKTQTIDVDCKDLTTRFACDIIGTCAFGLKVDSFVEEKNYFYEMGKLISHVDLIQLLLSFALFNFPNIVKVRNHLDRN